MPKWNSLSYSVSLKNFSTEFPLNASSAFSIALPTGRLNISSSTTLSFLTFLYKFCTFLGRFGKRFSISNNPSPSTGLSFVSDIIILSDFGGILYITTTFNIFIKK